MVITLTTDFGTADAYVGAMKGAILSIAPQARIVDISHAIPPQDILSAGLVLESACRYFPQGTIHVAVVDPGVGSSRAAIGIATDNYHFVGPDNGIFDLALKVEKQRDPQAVLVDRRPIRLSNPSFHRRPVSPTFHGRDIFAPVAAWLAAGNLLAHMGEPMDALVQLEVSRPRQTREGLLIHPLRADHFGNVITDLTAAEFSTWNADRREAVIEIAGEEIEIRDTYSDVPRFEMFAYFGSGGRLEIGVNCGRAVDIIGLNAPMLLKLL
ncbi:MAG TPA: SAM-dependent chlorinase/fluorinase [Planctomycetota bacterium]|nr:SAM-dependent chlorinase/fluorinase [Planctomycetota bacterium]